MAQEVCVSKVNIDTVTVWDFVSLVVFGSGQIDLFFLRIITQYLISETWFCYLESTLQSKGRLCGLEV